MALRSQILGRDGVLAYLGRILPQAPFGRGAELIHIVGGVAGGGFEWRATTSETRGLTAIELNPEGRITRITSTYDSRLLPEGVQENLVLLSLDRSDAAASERKAIGPGGLQAGQGRASRWARRSAKTASNIAVVSRPVLVL